MRPVKNPQRSYFQVGDTWDGHLITELRSCDSRFMCEGRYRNFSVACGGYMRIRGRHHAPPSFCPFFVHTLDNTLLTASIHGDPLL